MPRKSEKSNLQEIRRHQKFQTQFCRNIRVRHTRHITILFRKVEIFADFREDNTTVLCFSGVSYSSFCLPMSPPPREPNLNNQNAPDLRESADSALSLGEAMFFVEHAFDGGGAAGGGAGDDEGVVVVGDEGYVGGFCGHLGFLGRDLIEREMRIEETLGD